MEELIPTFQYDDGKSVRTIFVIEGQPFYISSGKNSGHAGTVFPFLGFNPQPSEYAPLFIKPSSYNKIPESITNIINPQGDYCGKENKELLRRFSSLECMVISMSLDSKYWSPNNFQSDYSSYDSDDYSSSSSDSDDDLDDGHKNASTSTDIQNNAPTKVEQVKHIINNQHRQILEKYAGKLKLNDKPEHVFKESDCPSWDEKVDMFTKMNELLTAHGMDKNKFMVSTNNYPQRNTTRRATRSNQPRNLRDLRNPRRRITGNNAASSRRVLMRNMTRTNTTFFKLNSGNIDKITPKNPPEKPKL
jgi:hypothetical protein